MNYYGGTFVSIAGVVVPICIRLRSSSTGVYAAACMLIRQLNKSQSPQPSATSSALLEREGPAVTLPVAAGFGGDVNQSTIRSSCKGKTSSVLKSRLPTKYEMPKDSLHARCSYHKGVV